MRGILVAVAVGLATWVIVGGLIVLLGCAKPCLPRFSQGCQSESDGWRNETRP